MEEIIITIDGKEFHTSYNKKNNANYLVNGKSFTVELLKKYNDKIFSLSVNNKLCQIEIDIAENTPSFITLDGLTFEIDTTDETKKLLKKFIQQIETEGGSGIKHVKAPMPGMVVKIIAEVGALVKKGDKVIIIEAMKMENALSSPVTGIVKTIKAKEGTAVEKDAVLIEIESGI